MIGLDTNIILRRVLGDVPDQARAAGELLDSLTVDEPGFVSTAVMVEVHSMLLRVVRLPKSGVLDVIESLLRAAELHFDDDETLWDALVLARNGADYPDALIALTGRLFGCDETVTFDRDAARLPGMRLLS